MDDDEDIHFLFRYWFSAELDLHFAFSGEEALSLVERHRFPVVMLDLVMPGKSGLEILSVLRNKSKLQKIIIITGHSCEQSAIQAINIGAFRYLEKPFSLAGMREAIEQAFDEYRSEWKSGVDRITRHEWSLLGLTSREAEISRMVVEGKTSLEIAGDIGVSRRTVEKHLEFIYSKVNISHRTQLGQRLADLTSRL